MLYVTSSIDEEKYSYQLDFHIHLLDQITRKSQVTDKKQSKYTNTLINLKISHNIWDFKDLVKFHIHVFLNFSINYLYLGNKGIAKFHLELSIQSTESFLINVLTLCILPWISNNQLLSNNNLHC